MEQIDNSLQVTIFQLGEKFNDIATKGRARIFYKGKNRNATYISEGFAKKLVSTVPYTPVKGIWDEEKKDFLDHGSARTQGKIYGVVLEDPNLTWEDFEDEDGEIRTYACVDVIIYTAIYPEASEIIGKSLSMEILPKTIKGEWRLIDGDRYYEFIDGSFAGLQALGDDVEPCFEGAQFFALYNQLQELYSRIQQYNLKKGGSKEMPELNFKLSDNQKFNAIWAEVNPSYNEEGEWTISAGVCDVYDDYALCFDYDSQSYFRQYFEKTEDTITFGCKKKAFVIDVDEEEYECLKKAKNYNNDSFAKIDEKFAEMQTKIDEYAAQISEKNSTIEEFSASVEEKDATIEAANLSINSLNESIENMKSELQTITASYSALEEERNALAEYKAQIELANKQAMIEKYSAKLDDEIIDTFTKKIDEYSIEQLEKDLSYELVKATPSIFSMNVEPMLPKQEPLTGLAAILERYK